MNRITFFHRAALFLCFSMFAGNAFTQITVRTDVAEVPIPKPRELDSSLNLAAQKQPVDYLQYVGQQLYFLPASKKYTIRDHVIEPRPTITFLYATKSAKLEKEGVLPFDSSETFRLYFKDMPKRERAVNSSYKKYKEQYEKRYVQYETAVYQPYFAPAAKGAYEGKACTIQDSVEGHYFTVLDVATQKLYSQEYIDPALLTIGENHDATGIGLKFILRNDLTGDTVLWKVERANTIVSYPFLLVPYFLKQQSQFAGKTFVARKPVNDLLELKTAGKLSILPDEQWTCTEVTVLELQTAPYMQPVYVLRNAKNEEVSLPLGTLERYFITKEANDERLRLEKLKAEELEKERVRLEKEKVRQQQEAQQRREQARADVIAKYGAEKGKLINQGEVSLGMTKEMCLAAWGRPMGKYSLPTGEEQWQYAYRTFLYFENGKLKHIQHL